MTGENDRDENPKSPEPSDKPLSRSERIQREREKKAHAKVEKRAAIAAEAESQKSERVPDEIEERAIEVAEQAREVTQEFIRDKGKHVAIAVLGVLGLLVAFFAARGIMAGGSAERAASLAEAGASESPEARATALAAVAEESSGDLAVWAKLGEAAAKLEAGDAAGAQKVYAGISVADLSPLLRRLTLEGLAAASLGAGDAKAAKGAFETLAKDDGAKSAAELGLARILASEGETQKARALLAGVKARLDEAGRRGRGFTLDEVEALSTALEGGS